jgi:hypothetical integral membrane protein (TIGR02206 family)
MPHYQPFVLFGRSHQIVLLLAVLVPVALAILVRWSKSATLARSIRWIFAVALIADWLYWYWLFGQRGWLNAGNELPVDLCSWAAIATIVALLWAGQKSYELAYFWALAGTLQGLLRPGLDYDFPDPLFIEFCVFHAGIIAAVLFLTLGLKMRPTLASFSRVIAWSFVYMGVAGAVDWALGVDYGFLRAKPIYPSLFDLMPAWPWYLPVLVVLGLLSMVIYYLPFAVIDLFKRRK